MITHWMEMYRLVLAPLGYNLRRGPGGGITIYQTDGPLSLHIPETQIAATLPQLVEDLETLEVLKLARRPEGVKP